MSHENQGRLRLRAFCACGHIGQRHFDEQPHRCANPECGCQGFQLPALERPTTDHWLPYHRQKRTHIPARQDPTR